MGNSLSSLFYTMCHCGFIFGSIFSNCNTCTQDSLSQNYLSVNTHILWKRWINTPDVANDSAPFEILSPVSVRHLMFHCFIPQVFFRKPVNQRFHLKANFGCTACRPAMSWTVTVQPFSVGMWLACSYWDWVPKPEGAVPVQNIVGKIFT